MAATRDQVYAEMTQMFGLVPSFFKLVPDNSLELEWRLFRTVQFDEGPIPNKYRERYRTEERFRRRVPSSRPSDPGSHWDTPAPAPGTPRGQGASSRSRLRSRRGWPRRFAS